MAAEQNWWDSYWKEASDPFLYHVTDALDWTVSEINQFVQHIGTHGLRPGSETGNSRWGGDLLARPGHVYLSCGLDNAKLYGPGIVFRVNPFDLDPVHVNPDEDLLLKEFEHTEYGYSSRGEMAAARDLSDPIDTHRSVEHGTLAHQGAIAAKQVAHIGYFQSGGERAVLRSHLPTEERPLSTLVAH